MKTPTRILAALGAAATLVACSVPSTGSSGRPGVEVTATDPSLAARTDKVDSRISGTVSMRGVGAAAGLEVKVYAAESGPQMPHWTTVTDGTGHFEVSVPAGSYNVLVRKPGSNLAAARFGVQANTVVDIDLVPTGEIRGKVVTKDGVDMTGTQVLVPGSDLSAWTDAEGSFVLGSVPFGSYTLVARRPAERILPRAVLDQGISPLVTVEAGTMAPVTEIPLVWDDQATASIGASGGFEDQPLEDQPLAVEFAPHPAALVYRLTVLDDEGMLLGQATGSAPPLAIFGLPAGLHWYHLSYSVTNGIAGAWAISKPRKAEVFGPRPADFALINPGTFVMGEAGSTNVTQSVTLTQGFFMQKTHVTQAQWQTLMNDNPSFRGCADCPVEQVSWFDAIGFANALSRKGGLPEVYNADGSLKSGSDIYATTGYRLPTEAEWEYAYRAGTTTRWYNGDDESKVGDIAWFGGNSGYLTQPVGQKQPNAFGLFDMAGNVWQWTNDWHDNYPGGALTDPAGPQSGSSRVVRGGSWFYDASIARAAFRGRSPTDYRSGDVGFRLARSRP